MSRRMLIGFSVVTFLILAGVFLSVPASDAAINIGLYNPNNQSGDDVNNSSPDYAYQYVSITIDFDDFDEEPIYVVPGGTVRVDVRAGDEVSTISNDLNLTLTGHASTGWRISGDVTEVYKASNYLITDNATSTTKLLTIGSEPDTTVYVTNGTLSAPSTTVEVGETFTVTATAQPSNATYKDVKWQPDRQFTVTGETDTTITGYFTEVGDYKIMARFQPKVYEANAGDMIWKTLYFTVTQEVSYNLAFDANGGTGGPNLLQHTSSETSYTFTIPNDKPTYQDHNFLGWATTDDATAPEYYIGDPVTLQASDPVELLYAVWEYAPTPYITITGPKNVNIPEEFTLNPIVHNGGTDPEVEWTIIDGEDLIEASSIQINNSFIGVAIAPGEATLRATWTEDSSVYLDWTLTITGTTTYTYNVPFNANGGQGPVPPTLEHVGPEAMWTFTIPTSPVPTRDNYTFTGWNSESDGTGSMYQPGQDLTLSYKLPSIELHAIWAETTEPYITARGPTNLAVTDEFDILATVHNGGDNPYVEWTVIDGEDLIYLNTIQISNNLNGVAIAPGEVTLRATWMEDSSVYLDWTLTITGTTTYTYNVPFNANGGQGPVPPTLEHVGPEAMWTFTIPTSPVPTRDNYTFTGWNSESDGTGSMYQPGWELTLTYQVPSMTLYAIWVAESEPNITISGPSELDVGDTFQLTATVQNSGNESGAVNWTVIDGGELVDLDETTGNSVSGKAVAAGEVRFRATWVADSGVFEDWVLEITTPTPIPPSSIEISGPGEIMLGDTGRIYANILPTNALNRGVIWGIVSGADLIDWTEESTYRGGMMVVGTLGAGQVVIKATSTADSSITATYTLTILMPGTDETAGTMDVNNIIQMLADTIFGGNTAIAGIVVFAAIMLAIFLIVREPLPILLISIPVTLILRLLRILDNDLTILLIIVSVFGLAMVARNMWRD